MRGNRSPRFQGNRPDGTIPARAGEPLPKRIWKPLPEDYPRSCGGTRPRGRAHRGEAGLSPLVRGNRDAPRVSRRRGGTIPARAGEPRVGRESGLCPRTIPARAGEPRIEHRLPQWFEDYPRSCGGTIVGHAPGLGRQGLSPLVRGNPDTTPTPWSRRGTIPARAGEPPATRLGLRPRRDYPRSCGGTGAALAGGGDVVGLSPLVRGNHGCPSRRSRRSGTIPARAGEPFEGFVLPGPAEDYPRSCGGTQMSFPFLIDAPGLSPLVRGNQAWIGLASQG